MAPAEFNYMFPYQPGSNGWSSNGPPTISREVLATHLNHHIVQRFLDPPRGTHIITARIGFGNPVEDIDVADYVAPVYHNFSPIAECAHQISSGANVSRGVMLSQSTNISRLVQSLRTIYPLILQNRTTPTYELLATWLQQSYEHLQNCYTVISNALERDSSGFDHLPPMQPLLDR